MAYSSDRWRQIEALFYEALESAPEGRSRFLDEKCAGDSELRRQVETLLASDGKPEDLLHQSVQEAAHRVMADDRREKMAPNTRLGHYKIISMLGSGGMGEVYLAEDTRLRRKVALKLIAPDLTREERGLRRFEQEALAASALNHPNILTIYEFGQAEEVRFIASEFIEGMTLREKIVVRRLDLAASIDIATQMASALSAAHNSGIVHRDIKPENVIIRTDGIVKVLDFGIAKLTEKRPADTSRLNASTLTSSVSEPGVVMGTAKYMSPEQARGLDVDARSDIFSLGSVMYELVTGRPAFEGPTTSDVIAEILKVEPPPPLEFAPDLPYEVERIISKALRKDRETRYQSVRDLLIDLQDFKKEFEFQSKLQESARAGTSRAAASKTSSDWRTPARVASGPIRSGLSRWKPFAWVAAFLIVIAASLGYLLLRSSNVLPTAAQPAEPGCAAVSESASRTRN